MRMNPLSEEPLAAAGRREVFGRLGLCLRTFRELSGHSQASIARKAGVGKSQMSKYERGEELPKLETLGRILAALDVTPLAFFYAHSVIERRFDPQRRAEVDLLLHVGSTGPLFRPREVEGFRRLFNEYLQVFEVAVEERILDQFREGNPKAC